MAIEPKLKFLIELYVILWIVSTFVDVVLTLILENMENTEENMESDI